MTRWAALIAALLATSPAQAQCLGFQCPPGVLGAGTSGAPAPLDGFTQPAAAYSFRKLRSAYSGPAARIIRDSDNAELDINFLGYTSFTGAPWDQAAALAHCGAANCYFVTVYDQSGNGRHATQPTPGPAARPQLLFSCNGSLACTRTTWTGIVLASSSVAWAAGLTSASTVARRTAGTTGLCNFVAKGSNRIGSGSTAAKWWATSFSGGVVEAAASDNVWHAGIAVIDGANSVLRVDGVETAGSATVSAAAGTVMFNGGDASTTCDVVEGIIWDNYTLTPAERLALRANQQSYWGTP